MNNHDHIDPCEHSELKHCKRCDVIHCKKCSKEWKISINSGLTGYLPNITYPSPGNQYPAKTAPCNNFTDARGIVM